MLVFCSTVADGSESRVPPSCSSELCYSSLQKSDAPSFRSKDCGSSRLSNVEFGLHKLRSQTLYNGLDGQICCWTCLLNNCWGLLICRSPSNNLPLLVLWMDFLRGSRVSMNAWGVTNAFHWQRYGLCYAKSVIQMLSVNLFNTNSTYLRHILNYF